MNAQVPTQTPLPVSVDEVGAGIPRPAPTALPHNVCLDCGCVIPERDRRKFRYQCRACVGPL